MGEVYLAHDTKLGRDVALKILPPHFAADPERRERFLREARLAAGISHPNVAAIHEADEAEGHLFFAMELVRGRTLQALVRPGGLTLDELLDVAIPLAEALVAAHRRGIVHRDLKPGNVMLDDQGYLKVLDFGLSRIVSDRPDSSVDLTKSSQILGTPYYMSPEQARGVEVDTRSDLFSLGAMLYELGCGAKPFAGTTQGDVMSAVLREEPPPMARANPRVDAGLERLVRRLLEKDVRSRVQTADDLLAALRSLRGARGGARASARRPLAIGIGAALAVAVVALFWLDRGTAASGRKLLAVLPFESIGPAANEFLADGITVAIDSRLATIHGLGVIARTSTLQYRGTTKPTPQIAEELGGDYLLEGTVQWGETSDGTRRVRVTPRLIDTRDASQVFAEPYETVVDDVFEIQAAVAERIASRLRLTVLGREASRRPTESLEAYAHYSRGLDLLRGPFEKREYEGAIEALDRAIGLDPSFADAYASRGSAHSLMYWFFYDRSEARTRAAAADVEKAFSIDPESPSARVARAEYLYRVELAYDEALEQLAEAQRIVPRDSAMLLLEGAIRRRMGDMERAAADMAEATVLDPRSAGTAYNTGETYSLLRSWDESNRHLEKARTLSPDWHVPYLNLGANAWKRSGDLVARRAWMERGLHEASLPTGPDAPVFVDVPMLMYEQLVLEGDYDAALDALRQQTTQPAGDQFDYEPLALQFARLHVYRDEPALARERFEQARSELAALVEENPDDPRYEGALGIALAGLGRKAEAIRHGQRAVELLPLSKDAFRGTNPIGDLAQVYLLVGEHDRAIDLLEQLLSIPSHTCKAPLRLAPLWRPLADHPRFKALVAPD